MEIIVGLLHDQKLLCCFEYSRVSCPELAKMLYIETDEVINEHSYMPKHINFVYLQAMQFHVCGNLIRM